MLLLQSSSWVNKYLHHFSSWFTFCLALFFSHKSSEVGGFTISHSRLHFQPWGLTFEQHYNYTTGRLLLELHFCAQCIIEILLLSICTGILGIFDILQFEISSLMNWIFFLVWKQTGYFYQFKLDFFPSSWARVKYFDGPCITIYSLFTIYRDIHYQFLVWWIHYTHCCE